MKAVLVKGPCKALPEGGGTTIGGDAAAPPRRHVSRDVLAKRLLGLEDERREREAKLLASFMDAHSDAMLLPGGQCRCTLTGAVMDLDVDLMTAHWNGAVYRRAAAARARASGRASKPAIEANAERPRPQRQDNKTVDAPLPPPTPPSPRCYAPQVPPTPPMRPRRSLLPDLGDGDNKENDSRTPHESFV